VDSQTGTVVIDNTALLAAPSATIGPKVFIVGSYFIIVYWAAAAALKYIAIPVGAPDKPTAPVTIATGNSITSPFDGATVPSGNLYISFPGSVTVRTFWITPQLVLSGIVNTIASAAPTSISMTIDTVNANVWVTWFDTNLLNIQAYDYNLANVVTAFAVGGPSSVVNIATVANAGVLTIFYEKSNTYSYTPNAPATPNNASNFIATVSYTVAGAISGPTTVFMRGVGLASKAFIHPYNNTTYVMVAYGGLMQPTYFLVDKSANIVCRLAASNGGGYTQASNLPAVSINGSSVQISYLYKDLTTSVNKGTNVPQGFQVAGIYSQLGINLATFNFLTSGMVTAELGGSLHLAGGQLYQFDGTKPVEHGFHVFPEDIGTTTSVNGGSMTSDTYYYVATYEWTDGQGILHRSAPSVPVKMAVPAGSSTNSVTINVPMLRLTAKTANNPPRIVVYRWSATNPVYYQINSPITTYPNNPAVDSVQIVDTLAQTGNVSIIGNAILYTTGGVIEHTAAPAVTSMCAYGTRLFAIDAEDQNLLWYSKQVISNVPVEMSDLLTLYVPPTISATGSTGPMRCLSALDDKLIIFKSGAIYYITGVGPDNTGANNDFSNPQFVTSTVGCANQNSIVFTPEGLMFQSDKGIWLLGRDLNTSYVGAPVEAYNSIPVVSANAMPGTNQVRFRLSNGVTLMYDYYFKQWGTFVGISGVSSTIYQGLETVITAPRIVSPPSQTPYTLPSQVYQETPGKYLDGSSPVLMSFQTGWMSMAGIQGYERFYQLLVLGNYLSPFKLNVQFAYDYISAINQSTLVSPLSPGSIFGLAPGPMGSESPFGGNPSPFKARIFPKIQKCETFQITVNELFDSSLGNVPGAGLTLSGLQMLAGVKKGSRITSASRSFG